MKVNRKMCTYTDIENIIKKVKKKLLFTETKLSIILKLKEFPAALFNFVFLLIILQLLLPPAISSTDCEKIILFKKIAKFTLIKILWQYSLTI